MNLRFYLDPETGLPHIYGHGVEEHEVEEVLRKPYEDRAGRNNSRVALGQTTGGRYLRVIYTRRQTTRDTPRDTFVVTAYELRGQPLRALRRRMRRKRK